MPEFPQQRSGTLEAITKTRKFYWKLMNSMWELRIARERLEETVQSLRQSVPAPAGDPWEDLRARESQRSGPNDVSQSAHREED